MIARKSLTPAAMVTMVSAMSREPHSAAALALLTDLNIRMVQRYINELHDGDLVHVGSWGRDARGYPTIEQYKWGRGADVPCPKKYANDAERMRCARALKKASAV